MTQAQRRHYLLRALLAERPECRDLSVPAQESDQKILLRSLMNLRPPAPISQEFLTAQDDYLQEALRERGITTLEELNLVMDGIYLWQGDITTLQCGAIVNAANAGLTGCYAPCHGCIDNAIHTYAGVQLRLACGELMAQQGHAEPPGGAKLTPAFNLPCQYVLHTVGPIVSGPVTRKDRDLLAACYRACLTLAEEQDIDSVAFCCISTGEYHFPQTLAAEIAVQTVLAFRAEFQSNIKVIFNVFKESDYHIYRKLLAGGTAAPPGP